MSGIKIPDTGRLLVDILPLGEKCPEIYPRNIIRAWRSEPDSRDLAFTNIGLFLVGETPQGECTRRFFVPEEALFRGVRENLVAMRISFLLLRGRVSPRDN